MKKHIRTDKSIHPTDFLNRKMWSSTVWKEGETVEVKTGSDEVSAVSVTFTSFGEDTASGEDAADENRVLATTAFDGRVVEAVSALYDAGITETTVERIHFQMGNMSRPSKKQRTKDLASLETMSLAQVRIKAYKEAEAYGNNKYRFSYEGSLLPIKIDGAKITILAEPPTTAFAKKRGHITTRSMKLLQTPWLHTEAYIRIEDYLIYRIRYGKYKLQDEGKKDDKLVILIDTLREETAVSDRQLDNVRNGDGKIIGTRLSVKLERILAHYKSCSEVFDFTIDERAITIWFDEPVSKS